LPGAGQQGTRVHQHQRVVVGIHDPAGRGDALGYLLGAVRGGQARADIQKLLDTALSLRSALLMLVAGEEEDVNTRVALRLAHGWTQGHVATLWNERWPAKDGGTGITDKNISSRIT
jgi:hypothetical protein